MIDDLKGFLQILRNGDGYDQRAADEIATLRERLEKAEREGYVNGYHDALTNFDVCTCGPCSIHPTLSPTDNTTTVAEADSEGPYTCRSCCAATWNDCDVCDDCILAAQKEE